ncbi:MAG: phosphoribosylformylglycinamidine synthase subunit PurS [Planctomycetes bacterium]|nr:phosphoribosylformylglycinamidine synthase subunit PurS [Planctomycetota bacterium]
MGLWRFEVSSIGAEPDPAGLSVRSQLIDFGVQSVEQVRASRVFVVGLPRSEPTKERQTADRIGRFLLADPVAETCRITGESDPLPTANGQAVEIHLKPGVMDNVALSTAAALSDMGIAAISVRTARRFVLQPAPVASELARIHRLMGNACIEDVFLGTRPLMPPPEPPTYEYELRHVAIRTLDDSGLITLSTNGHLFLALDEMRTIQAHYLRLDRGPTDLELETIAQTWSEHCVHKTLKSAILYRGAAMPGDTSSTTERRYDNLLKDTIARATDELIREKRGPQCLSVFKDNAGIIAFDDTHAVAFKVETHNHPSAIEPYGGASTGVGGVIRDVLGCGLGAQPIANTDVFCVAPPSWPNDAVPKGVIHPKTVLKGVVCGVRDYGNRMGIPTVNGAVHFDARYLGNPLVYCGCVGLIPRDRIEKQVNPGDLIVVMGGRTGRDGIHGATFSSAELTDTHEDEFAHAVQIGNAIEEKKVLDVVMQARDWVTPDGKRMCLFSSITDCGAGGLSSAIGEMAADGGAEVELDKVPLKYAGLRYDEIWISEAQERMVLAVPEENVAALLALATSEEVEATVIGRFTDTNRLVIRYQNNVVGELDLRFLHDGLPRTVREAEWLSSPTAAPISNQRETLSPEKILEKLRNRLSNPNAASKHWIIRQYDHEVGARTVVKPLVGPGNGPSDAAVLRPRPDSTRGIALGCGLATEATERDPYWMAVAAIDEAIRNVVCVGGDPSRTAILDNFCWPRVDDKRNLGALVRACQACYDVAKAYGVPFISGKDSLNNEFSLDPADIELVRNADKTDPTRNGRIAIPYTLLISAIALVDDVNRCITSAPRLLNGYGELWVVGMDNSSWQDASMAKLAAFHRCIADLIREGRILAAHDCSEGGYLSAIAEMAIAANISVDVSIPAEGLLADPFGPLISAYVVQPKSADVFMNRAFGNGIHACRIAKLDSDAFNPAIKINGATATIAELRRAWQAPLDW